MNSPLEFLLSLVVAAPCLRGRADGEQSALGEPAWKREDLGERTLLAVRALLRLHLAALRAEPEWISSREMAGVRAYPGPVVCRRKRIRTSHHFVALIAVLLALLTRPTQRSNVYPRWGQTECYIALELPKPVVQYSLRHSRRGK